MKKIIDKKSIILVYYSDNRHRRSGPISKTYFNQKYIKNKVNKHTSTPNWILSEDGKITVSSLPFLLYYTFSQWLSKQFQLCRRFYCSISDFEIRPVLGRCDEKKLQLARQNADRVAVKVLKSNVKTLNHQQWWWFSFSNDWLTTSLKAWLWWSQLFKCRV